MRAIWPDFLWTIEDIFGEGDRVAARMTNRATHQGVYRGIPATGREVIFQALWIFRLEQGKIAEVWLSADDLGWVVRIGGKIVPGDDAWRWCPATMRFARGFLDKLGMTLAG